ncbi:MAG: hypothetical protein ACOCXS_00695 [Bacteroidota bacterium]
MNTIPAFRNWWLLGLKGLLLLLFGLSLIFDFQVFWPLYTFTGYFFLAVGLVMVVFAASNAFIVPFWFWLIEGIAEIIIGTIILFIKSGMTYGDFSFLLVIWTFIIAAGILLSRLEKQRFLSSKGIRIIFPVLSLIAGILILISNSNKFITTEDIIGIFAILLSTFYIFNSIKYSTSIKTKA